MLYVKFYLLGSFVFLGFLFNYFTCIFPFPVSPSGLVTVVPENQIADRLDNVTFTCLSSAGPNNLYTWVHNASSSLCDENCTEVDIDGEFKSSDYIEI